MILRILASVVIILLGIFLAKYCYNKVSEDILIAPIIGFSGSLGFMMFLLMIYILLKPIFQEYI